MEVNDNADDTLVVRRSQQRRRLSMWNQVDEWLTLETAPVPMFGSYNATGLASDFCLDRHARYDPYGYDEGDLEGNGRKRKSNRASKVQWDKVNWGYLQGDCLLRNQDRYEPPQFLNRTTTFWMPRDEDVQDVDSTIVLPDDSPLESMSYRLWKSNQKYKQRTAIILRTGDSNEWTVDTMQYIRSMIVELALHSGAEYEVIIMVEILDASAPIFDNDASYQQTLNKVVPAEFKNNTLLFNRQLLDNWYPKAGQHELVPISLPSIYAHLVLGPKLRRQDTWRSLCNFFPSYDLRLNISGKSTWTFGIPVTTITTLRQYQRGQKSSQENTFGSALLDTISLISMATGQISWKLSRIRLP